MTARYSASTAYLRQLQPRKLFEEAARLHVALQRLILASSLAEAVPVDRFQKYCMKGDIGQSNSVVSSHFSSN
jgi:hypothetical protein